MVENVLGGVHDPLSTDVSRVLGFPPFSWYTKSCHQEIHTTDLLVVVVVVVVDTWPLFPFMKPGDGSGWFIFYNTHPKT